MMDEHTATAAPSGKISSLFGEGGAQNSQQMHHNPFSSSSYYHQHQYGAGDDSGAGSEEGFDLSEEPAKPATHRSGSKRSRAADVHNLSEKRRRSRINEKMKALQNLIPNSNKTDKASMLDEAIEYLKQLQLQVQMLFMRNGLNSHPNLPGALHQLQACQLCMSFRDSTSAMNMAILGMLPHNPDSAPNKSFDLTGQCMTFHQTAMLPPASISAPETSFELEPLQSHHPSLKLQVPGEEIFIEAMVSQQQLDSGRNTRNLAENVMKTMDVASSLQFGGQASSSSLEHNDHLEDVLPKDHPDNNPVFSQNFNGVQTGRSFTKDNVKPETLRI